MVSMASFICFEVQYHFEDDIHTLEQDPEMYLMIFSLCIRDSKQRKSESKKVWTKQKKRPYFLVHSVYLLIVLTQ